MRRPGFEPDGETVLLASLRSAARIGTRVVQIPLTTSLLTSVLTGSQGDPVCSRERCSRERRRSASAGI